MAVPVSYIRKYDSKLQIEMLRAYRPDRFKTAGVNVNIGAKGDIFVLTEEQRHELQEIHRRSLDAQVVRAQPQGRVCLPVGSNHSVELIN